MAYTSWQSGAIPEGTQYYTSKQPLGDYTFYLQFDATSGTPTVVARCDYPSGIRGAAQKTLPEGSQISGWSIDANDTTADVYAIVRTVGHGGASGKPLAVGDYLGEVTSPPSTALASAYSETESSSVFINNLTLASINRFAFTYSYEAHDGSYHGTALSWGGQHSYKGQSFYAAKVSGELDLQAAYDCLFGLSDPRDVLIARFAINLGDAGGYPGGGGGWTQPGDWNPDPTTTLHLSVNGALSGRHNDPLNDTSFSYVPADKATVKDYGCGGDGGNGGGGGAGASTIIVRQFATNKANSKNILALAKCHGYGSGGGKGGKGGDGCILIYY